jgi:protease PrsW
MDRFAVFLAATTPGLLVLTYGVIKTRGVWSNEALWTAFLLGALAPALVLPIELAVKWVVELGSPAPLTKAGMLAVFEAAIPEEAVKYLILVGVAERHVDAWRRQDIIVLSLAVSLGFATVENFLFVLTPANWALRAATRALSAVPGHGVMGLTMGALLTAARVAPSRRSMWATLAFVGPTTMHAAYDFPILAIHGTPRGWFVVLWLAILVGSSIVAIWLCNWILPAAALADRRSGHDLSADLPAPFVAAAGGVLLVAAGILVIVIMRYGGLRPPAMAGVFAVFPVALALDLIWTGSRRRSGRPLTAANDGDK